MVRPYYGAKRAHNTHTPSHPTSKLLGSQITFYTVLKLLSLNPKHSRCTRYTCERRVTVRELFCLRRRNGVTVNSIPQKFCYGEHWSGDRRTCRTCSYGPVMMSVHVSPQLYQHPMQYMYSANLLLHAREGNKLILANVHWCKVSILRPLYP